jgi:hypothetical protein
MPARMVPGTVYHYRLVAATPSETSYGHDAILANTQGPVASRAWSHHSLSLDPGALPLPSARLDEAAFWRHEVGRLSVRRHRDRHGDARRHGSRHTPHACEQGLQLRQHRGLHDRTAAWTRTPVFRTSFGGNRQLMAGPAPTLHALFG